MNENIVVIDSRCAGYMGEPMRMIVVTMADSGKILVEKQANYYEPVIPKDNTLVVTDTPKVFSHWSLAFDEKKHLKEVLQIFLEVKRSGLLAINDTIRMYNPSDFLQTKKVDETGQVLEFDISINNGHIAIVLAVWGAYMARQGFMLTHEQAFDDSDDDWLVPFSV